MGARPLHRAAAAARAHPRESCCDTLLLWQPKVQLNAQGQAVVEVPLNDALTSFTIVAVAERRGAALWHGQCATFATSQDLQVIAVCRRWCARAISSAPC